MPHIIVKLGSGRTDEEKARLAEAVTQAVVKALDIDETLVSVAVEDVDQGDWTEKVYKPDILGNPANIYKKPGYDPR